MLNKKVPKITFTVAVTEPFSYLIHRLQAWITVLGSVQTLSRGHEVKHIVTFSIQTVLSWNIAVRAISIFGTMKRSCFYKGVQPKLFEIEGGHMWVDWELTTIKISRRAECILGLGMRILRTRFAPYSSWTACPLGSGPAFLTWIVCQNYPRLFDVSVSSRVI